MHDAFACVAFELAMHGRDGDIVEFAAFEFFFEIAEVSGWAFSSEGGAVGVEGCGSFPSRLDRGDDDERLLSLFDFFVEPVVDGRAFVWCDEFGGDRFSTLWKVLDGGDVKVAEDRESDGAGDWGRGHHDDMGSLVGLLHSLLDGAFDAELGALFDTEAVLLVDDRDGEGVERDGVGDERVCPDNEVDLS